MSRPPIVDERRPIVAVRRPTGAWIGVLSAAVALGTAELLAVAFGPGSSPIVSVGGVVVDSSPEWLKSFAIRTFGSNDKLVLLAGIVVVVVLLAVVLGIAAGRPPHLGIGALMVLGAVGAAAAVSRP